MLRTAAATALALLGLGAALAGRATAGALQPIPPLQERVTDLTGTLTAAQQTDLEQKLADFEARKGAQIAVLIVPTTRPEAIEQYSIRVVDAWKLGRKHIDDGALLLIAKNDHRLRIEVGYGLEGVLTDATSNDIIDETMVPLLRQGQYYAAINAGVDRMMTVIDGQPLPAPDTVWQPHRAPRAFNWLPFLLVAFLVGSSALRAAFGRALGAGFSAAGMGVLVFLIAQSIGVALGVALLSFVGAALLGSAGGSWSSAGRGRPGGWGGWGAWGGWGGWGGGGGFGGGGFGGGGLGGGFSGGGGGFGGGGASGGW